ncbi:hypothetical protein BEN47_19430 [Hymenobacter lapidarius]|uniref:Secretion system C-terminal sorting domain-containing protein n=1 Tax=Hymenobacter lapidarius TaxID=1908237 RepID=A0A1G1SR52_9BACT|nr:T9SS type A sorting domain-containing protein [Hymenobacter lapidarius]OGX81109.1 hypothetical protein BEN47_19430 [Hymenobacter lapidarius]
MNKKPLPVELISFEAVRSDKVALLTWATASEKNSAYFAVERSVDGKSFESIGQRPGAGNTSARTNYEFADVRLGETAAPVVYYRLRQVDASGETAYSPVRRLTGVGTATLDAAVFPNPYAGAVAVRFHSAGPEAPALTVRNVLGQLVMAATLAPGAGPQEVALPQAAAWPLGMYFLTIRQGAQQQVLRLSHR